MVNKAIKEPKEPMLIIEPKRPLFTANWDFSSGNLGIQAMMPRPNRKKRSLVRATSRLIKIAHSLDLFELESIGDLLDQPTRTNLRDVFWHVRVRYQ